MNEQRIIRPYPGFIIPTRRFVDVGMPTSKVCASGRYQLIVRDAWGVEKRRTPWFDNIILDIGLNRWGTGPIIACAAIGTGTATPASTDTGLQTPAHYTTTTGTGHDAISAGISPNYNNTRTFVYRTVLGQLNGNYYEVGVGWASGSNVMFSRALILDGGGSPTFVSVSSAEQLDIVYQLSVYPPLVDTGPTTVTISGSNYDVTGRASYVTQTTGSQGWTVGIGAIAHSNAAVWSVFGTGGSLGAITTGPSAGSSSGSTTAATSAYVNNSMTANCASSYALAAGNVTGGVKMLIAAWSMACFKYEFNNAIPKDSTKTLSLNCSVTWARRP